MAQPVQPLYSAPGPFAVAHREFALPIGDQILHVAAYYPLIDAHATVRRGPFPLVVFSPGLGSSAAPYARLLEPIASHGFVILAPSPRGESGPEFWKGAATRPLDLQRVVHDADALNASGGALEGLIDTRSIAMVGHSSGGWAALVGGGARMDLGWCVHPDPATTPEDGNCPQFVAHRTDIAAMLGLGAAPTGLWPGMHDPRVKAVIALSPDGDIWGDAYQGVASVTVPTMIMAGSDDGANVPAFCAYPIHAHLGSVDKTLVVFAHGDHDLGWDTHADAIKHLVTAFLLAHLSDDPDAVNALLPSHAVFDGVRYDRAGDATR